MPHLHVQPELVGDSLPFIIQEVRLLDDQTPVAWARWAADGTDAHGTAQLLQFEVAQSCRRQGHGSLLMRELLRQADQYFRLRGQRGRRMWVLIAQKSQVVARAFVTEHGFHHVGTMKNHFKGQDAMIYTRAFS